MRPSAKRRLLVFAAFVLGGGYIYTEAAASGLNMDGSPDGQCNGRGAPVPVLPPVKKFGRLTRAQGQHVEVASLDSDLTSVARIVDPGPQRALRGDGKIRVKYRFV